MSKILKRIGLPALAVLWLGSCDFLDLGPMLVSEQDEVRLGAQFDAHLRTDDSARRQYPLYVPRPGVAADAVFQQYVLDLAQSIVNAIPADEKPGYPFKFAIVNADVDNAFAVPGGYVYIYTGIIKHMQDESELAGVLGHEIAHVTRHHYRDALVKQTGLSLLVQALVGNDAGRLAQLVAQSFSALAALAITRGNESESDVYGTRYAAAVGRNPLGIASFFARMQAQAVPAVFSTHPPAPSRVADVTAQVSGDATLNALATDSLKFAARFLQMTAAIRP